MRNVHRVVAAAVLSVAGGSVGAVRAQGPTPDAGVPAVAVFAADREGSERAFLPGATEMVAAARATVLPHPAGRYALLVRREEAPPPGPMIGSPHTGGASLLLYDAVARRTRVLWESPAANGTREAEIATVEWLPGTDLVVALVVVIDRAAPTPEGRLPVHTLLLADAARDGRARALRTVGGDGGEKWLTVSVSPTRPRALVVESDLSGVEAGQETLTLRFLDARGRLGQPITTKGFSMFSGWAWDDAGDEAIAAIFPPRPTPDAPRPARRYARIAADGRITELTERPKRTPRPAAATLMPPVRPVPGSGRADAPEKSATPGVPLRPLWLAPATEASSSAATAGRLFLAPHAEEAWALPDGSAVLYRAQGAVYAVPLTRLPRDRYEAAVVAAQKQQAIARAKQVGLACLMYAQDHDETLPPTGTAAEALQPYLRSMDVLNDPRTGRPAFAFLMGGVTLASVAEVAKTPLGYLPGPGGRAVLYVDGHVKWEDAPPSPAKSAP